jgi:hypothetical protein
MVPDEVEAGRRTRADAIVAALPRDELTEANALQRAIASI